MRTRKFLNFPLRESCGSLFLLRRKDEPIMKKNTVNEKNTPNYLLYFVVIVFALMAFATVATIKQNHAKAASSIEPGNCKYYDMYAEAGGPETIGKIDLKTSSKPNSQWLPYISTLLIKLLYEPV